MVGRASFLRACGKEIHRQPRDSVGGGTGAAERREEGANSRSQLITLGMRAELRQMLWFAAGLCQFLIPLTPKGPDPPKHLTWEYSAHARAREPGHAPHHHYLISNDWVFLSVGSLKPSHSPAFCHVLLSLISLCTL